MKTAKAAVDCVEAGTRRRRSFMVEGAVVAVKTLDSTAASIQIGTVLAGSAFTGPSPRLSGPVIASSRERHDPGDPPPI
jgi:hypothetical protein